MRLGLLVAVAGPLLGQAMPEPYGTLVTFGPLGIFVTLYLAGIIPSKGELDRMIARAEKAEAQRDALVERAASETIPLLGEVQRTMVPALERLTAEVQGLRGDMQRLAERGRS